MEKTKYMKCSIVILNWNGANMLQRYLPSVLAFSNMEGVEVVVADNGSTDNSLQLLADSFPSVRTILLDNNYGFAGGYNKAIEQIDSEYVILLNSDVEVTENWLTPLFDFMDNNAQYAAIQPKVLSWNSRQEHISDSSLPIQFEHAGAAGGYLDIFGYPYCRGRIVDAVEEDRGQYDTIATTFWATGACLCVRTQVYKDLGGLDDEFFAHMEEIDLCWRMNCRGYKVACIPASVIYHLGGGSLPYNNPRKTYLNFRNNLLMLYKNLPCWRLMGIMLIRFLFDYTAALQMLVTRQAKNALSVVKARMDFLSMMLSKSFHSKRRENMKKMIVPYPTTIMKRSIIIDYYLRKKRIF